MSQNQTKFKIVDQKTVTDTSYDAVIVGSGVAGAIVAKQLSEQGKHVLILEAGEEKNLTLEGFQSYVDTFYGAVDKNANAPYPYNPNAPSPTDGVHEYFKEMASENKDLLPLSGSYTRVPGGTTMHWEGKTIRMLPDDFKLKTNYGHGLDWPISYQDLMPYYRKAEYEIGVSGDVEGQKGLGAVFDEGYVFPMKELPPSYLDQKVGEKIEGTTVELGEQTMTLSLSTFPQGRNSIPNPDYQNYNYGENYIPGGVASINPVEFGERCQGNANCVSICPVQAKYDARKTLNTIAFPERVDFLPQAVAFKVEVGENGRVTGIHYKKYQDKGSSEHTEGIAKGTLFVLATNAVENAKLMLASKIPGTNENDMMGRHLMDHPFLLAWGLMPEVTGTMRGPLVTSGIGTFRNGSFRKDQAAFAMDIHNDGWGWSGTGATDILEDAVDQGHKFGRELRQELISRISRQLLLAFMCELPANFNNRVTIDEQYKTDLGNYRPVIYFDVADYCKDTFVDARRLSKTIFERLGAEDHTTYDQRDEDGNLDPAHFVYQGQSYWFRGGNHFSGTHIMGASKSDSVVDHNQRSWDHENLYIIGAGSMPSIGSSNTTLTIAALSFKSSEQMLKDLNS
ncbi:MAG: GMC family oxidoreductase [Cyanobacteria bacterium J06642_3]